MPLFTRKLLVAVSSVFLITAVFFSPAFALVARKGDTILVPASEVVKEDLYIAGDTAIIEGTVEGDLWSACRSLTLHGSVKGSIFAVGGDITLAGNVENGVKVIGGNLSVAERIGRDLFVLGNKVSIDKSAAIGGDFFVGAGDVLIDGPVGGTMRGAARTAIMGGFVGEDAFLYIKYLTLSDGAHISGDLTYTSVEEALVRPGARIDGTTTHHVPEYRKRIRKIFPFIILAGVAGKIFQFLTTVLVGLVFILAAARPVLLLSEGIRKRPGASAGWGAIILFGVPIGVALALGTVVGIGLGMVAASAYFIALLLGYVAISLTIGRLILGQSAQIKNKGAIFGSFVLGLFIITLLRFVPVFGYFVWFAASLFGLGSIVTAMIIKGEESKKKIH